MVKAVKGMMIGAVFAAVFWLVMLWILRERVKHIPEFFRGQ